MLQITIPAKEYYDERTRTFIQVKEQTLQLEHSLLSISKWESKWCKTFLSNKKRSREEMVDYVKCMTLTQNVRPEVYFGLTDANIAEIKAYIEAPMTAVYFETDNESASGRDAVTSELIYYWMISLGIPFECQKWHLNRLLAFIRVCNVKNQAQAGGGRVTQSDIARRRALNAARKNKYNTRG